MQLDSSYSKSIRKFPDFNSDFKVNCELVISARPKLDCYRREKTGMDYGSDGVDEC